LPHDLLRERNFEIHSQGSYPGSYFELAEAGWKPRYFGRLPLRRRLRLFIILTIIMENKITSIEVIGSGCGNCKKLHELAVAAAKELNIGTEVGYSRDIQKALAMGVMQFPVLAVNGKAVLTGSADMEKVRKELSQRKGGNDQSYPCSCGGDCGCL
jgi:hypothetical protein